MPQKQHCSSSPHISCQPPVCHLSGRAWELWSEITVKGLHSPVSVMPCRERVTACWELHCFFFLFFFFSHKFKTLLSHINSVTKKNNFLKWRLVYLASRSSSLLVLSADDLRCNNTGGSKTSVCGLAEVCEVMSFSPDPQFPACIGPTHPSADDIIDLDWTFKSNVTLKDASHLREHCWVLHSVSHYT